MTEETTTLNYPKAEWQSDGSLVIHIPPNMARNLIDTFIEWEKIGNMQFTPELQGGNWKRSATLRENRRESITHSNCLGRVLMYLDRRFFHKEMAELGNSRRSLESGRDRVEEIKVK